MRRVQAIAGEQALKGRRVIKSRGTGEEHWRTDYLGRQGNGGAILNEPQAFLVEIPRSGQDRVRALGAERSFRQQAELELNPGAGQRPLLDPAWNAELRSPARVQS